LDAHTVSFGDGAIALHSETGIPLRSLGTGSTRLLIAGLQRAAADSASVVLVDELEYGLEPHRLTRLLGSLGAKDATLPLQVFMTTHSPVALRELSGSQLLVVRGTAAGHYVVPVGTADDVQSTIRKDPEALLASTVIVCEGASEVGFLRGMDEHWVAQGHTSLMASGVAYVDTSGGEADRCFKRGMALLGLGYRVMAFLDNDKPSTEAVVNGFVGAGGKVVSWRAGRALEDEMFQSLSPDAVSALVQRALELTEDGRVDEHIKTRSNGAWSLGRVSSHVQQQGFTPEVRALLGSASRIRKAGWFKSVSKMEGVARDIVGPNLGTAESGFTDLVHDIFGWAHAGTRT
jgi:putative ATP-dependent endonuclease of OLD family